MNKNLYRIVFSAARGMRIAVQENARSAGKAPGTSSGVLGIAAAAVLALAPAQAQIAADPNAPGSQRPTVLVAPNGTPLINIQAPSAAGVSRNVYRQFDVNANGAILNNSRTAVQSQLGGYVQGNPWLARGSARVILNEVNSSSPSYLRGHVEVAGPKAEVILANPAGIQVQGGGFINAHRVTLTTGVPQFNTFGGIESYRVTGGTIGVSGAGLDASGTDFAALYARMVSINAGVWGGGELRVVTGANQVSADGAPGVAANVTPIAGSGAAQPVAFDVARLGGMYAQKIWIMGTEAGVGARNAGTIQTGAGNSALMGLGELTVTASGHIENIGTMQATGSTVVTASSLMNSGTVLSAAGATVATQGELRNAGTVEGQRIELASAAGDIVNSGMIRQTSMAALTLAAPLLSNTAGGVIGAEPAPVAPPQGVANAGNSAGSSGSSSSSGSAPASSSGTASGSAADTGTNVGTPGASAYVPPSPGTITAAAGTIRNDGGEIYAGGPITLQTPQLVNSEGSLSVDALAVTGPAFSNAAGTLNIANGFSANVGSFDNSAGKLHAGSMNVTTSGDFNNADGLIESNGDVALNVGGAASNERGAISAAGALTAAVSGAIQNASGSLVANQAVSIQGGSLDNTLGTVSSAAAGTTLSFVNALANSGTIGAATDLSVRAGSLSNTGSVRAGQDASLAISGQLANDGSITAARNTTVSAASLHGGRMGVLAAGVLTDGSLADTGDLNVTTAGALVAQGTHLAAGNAAMQGASVDLSASQTSAANIAVAATHGNVTTRGATVATAGTLGVSANAEAGSALLNDGGQLNAGELDLHVANIANTNGGEIVQTGTGATTIAVTGTIDNSAGRIASNGATTISAASLDNSGGQTLAVGDLSISAGGVINSGGLIRSAATTTLSAASIVNANTSGADQGIEGRNVALNVGNLENTSGAIRADADTTITSGGQVNNTSGLISAGNTLRIVDANAAHPAAKTLDIVNSGGTLAANQGIQLDAAKLGFDGALSTGKDLSIQLTQDLVNDAELSVSGDLTYATTGNLTNNGKLLAGGTLTAGGNAVENTANAEMSGMDTFIRASTLDNRGLIDSHGQTRIDAGTVNNIGTGRIYGDEVAIGAGILNNVAEIANGTTSSATVAARASLDIGADTINNRDGSLIFSAGDIYIGGALDGNGFATGRGGTLNNESATIESLGDMSISMAQVNNLDTRMKVVQETSSTQERYLVTTADLKRWSLDDTRGDPITGQVWHRNPDGTETLVGIGYGDWNVTHTTTRDVATDVAPARLIAGGGMNIDGHLRNRDSKVTAGGSLTATSVDNTPTRGTSTTSHSGVTFGCDGSGSCAPFAVAPWSDPAQTIDVGGFTYEANTDSTTGRAPSAGPSNNASGGTSDRNGPGTVIEVASAVNGAGAVDANGNATAMQAVPLVVRTSTPDTRVPSASLFRTRPGPGSYLIETDPRFANYRNWLGSDYLLNALGFDPNSVQKRLGDGFYEQKLVREQIAQLTGYRYLEGYANDEEQYIALMNAGVTFAQKFNLTPGVTLSAEQMAQLTSDIVWLVEQTVTLPDGSTQTVLTPQVYVRVRPGDIDGSGALLSAERTIIRNKAGEGDFTNGGTVAGRSLVSITADSINHLGGRVSGGDVMFDARNDINVIGGQVDARDSLVAKAGRDINVVTTTSSANGALTSATAIDQIAGLYVSNPGGTLVASAGRDANLIGAIIQNQGGGSTSITAGRDINLGTVTESNSRLDITGPKGYVASSSSRETGTAISTNGTTILSAKRDINARQADVNAGAGLLVANAGRNVNIVDGQAKESFDYSSQSTKKGAISKTTTTVTASQESSTSVGSSFKGDLVSLHADNNVNIVGSHISGTRGVGVTAGNELNVVEGRNTQTSSVGFNRTKSTSVPDPLHGLDRSSGNAIETRTDNAAASTITGTNGGVRLEGGNSVYMRGAQVSADKDLTIKGGEVTITGAVDESGLTIGNTRATKANHASVFHGFKGESESIQDANAASLARSTLLGADVSITATGGNGTSGAVTIGGTTINTPGKVALEGDSVHLALQSTDATMTHTGGRSNLTWQSTKDSGAANETLHYNQINAGSFEVKADHVTAGMNARDSVEALSRQPGMAWIGQITSDPSLAGKVDWQKVEEAHKQWDYGNSGLTPEGAAVVTAVVTYLTWGAASAAGGAVASAVGGGTVVSGAVAAGVSALASQASIALINNKGDLGAALDDLGSSGNVKALATAIVTGGVLGGLNLNPTGLPTQGAGGTEVMSQLGKNLTAGAAKAVISTAINGGSLEQTLKEGILNAFLDTAAATGATWIGGNLEGVVNKVAHAIAGCAVGAARTDGSCAAGALGAVIGELSAELYGREIDTVQFANMMSSIAAAIAGGDVNEINLAGQAGANAAASNYLSHDQWAMLADDLAACQRDGCTPAQERALQARYMDISNTQDRALLAACQAGSARCQTLLNAALDGAATQQDLIQAGKLPDYYWAGSDLSATAKLLNSPQFKGATSEQAAEMAAEMAAALGGIVLDFTPGVGDLKAFLEAETPFDHALATLGLVPGLGDAGAKLIKEAKHYAEAGDAVAALNKLREAKASLSAPMLGAKGTQTQSTTVWRGEGKARIDVENPNPGQRPGQVHYQDNNNNKFYYQPSTNSFTADAQGTIPAPKKVQALLEDRAFAAGINKALRYLGE